MLNLATPTDPAWILTAVESIDEVLLDHAHCEKKAAGAALKLLFAYPQHRFLQEPLSRLAREELTHFEVVLGALDARGVRFERQRPSSYGGRLHSLVRIADPERLVDLLLIAALIEARSCERFKLLSEALDDPALAALYGDLLASEARHHQIYVDLASRLRPAPEVRARLAGLAIAEAEILSEPASIVRLHT